MFRCTVPLREYRPILIVSKPLGKVSVQKRSALANEIRPPPTGWQIQRPGVSFMPPGWRGENGLGRKLIEMSDSDLDAYLLSRVKQIVDRCTRASGNYVLAEIRDLALYAPSLRKPVLEGVEEEFNVKIPHLHERKIQLVQHIIDWLRQSVQIARPPPTYDDMPEDIKAYTGALYDQYVRSIERQEAEYRELAQLADQPEWKYNWSDLIPGAKDVQPREPVVTAPLTERGEKMLADEAAWKEKVRAQQDRRLKHAKTKRPKLGATRVRAKGKFHRKRAKKAV
eukprot:TRINITY_DN7113_c0_g1_i1.p1 TRINITY_DN7113_c0_g1~~TRINITY_DN7113_c0_g1_i1.p1  ORF type:complete len:282 (-),score=46.14 TRINITY_DN7113_c0_g1_i1:24-869(-)